MRGCSYVLIFAANEMKLLK